MFKIAPKNRPSARASSLPTIIFHGRAVKFRGCTTKHISSSRNPPHHSASSRTLQRTRSNSVSPDGLKGVGLKRNTSFCWGWSSHKGYINPYYWVDDHPLLNIWKSWEFSAAVDFQGTTKTLSTKTAPKIHPPHPKNHQAFLSRFLLNNEP